MGELTIKERNKVSNSGRKSRAKGLVPGVIYGKGMSNLMFEVGCLELGKEISNSGEHGILNVNFNGETKSALIKEVQREPINHDVIHLDLELLDGNSQIETDIPIQYVGEGFLTQKGAVLQKEKDLVKISCESNKLPKSIKLDVSKGVDGSVYKLGDLEFGEEITLLENLDTVIAAIANERKLTSDLMAEEKSEVINDKVHK
ncbi:50S ribosomal protein L25/general stress protein Ctc [Clostridium sardiniense]|uniref:50S ribosomal protein L25 n=1 Tax=Clostridium sardiniense TaxID=29369 RepID=UPI00195B7BB3|nr:50S ribosomal protein L25 [Clostridium sardiniense]MBM7835888.1 large subunit ribosomal protein L25 [Clostridium sardiniense]